MSAQTPPHNDKMEGSCNCHLVVNELGIAKLQAEISLSLPAITHCSSFCRHGYNPTKSLLDQGEVAATTVGFEITPQTTL